MTKNLNWIAATRHAWSIANAVKKIGPPGGLNAGIESLMAEQTLLLFHKLKDRVCAQATHQLKRSLRLSRYYHNFRHNHSLTSGVKSATLINDKKGGRSIRLCLSLASSRSLPSYHWKVGREWGDIDKTKKPLRLITVRAWFLWCARRDSNSWPSGS